MTKEWLASAIQCFPILATSTAVDIKLKTVKGEQKHKLNRHVFPTEAA